MIASTPEELLDQLRSCPAGWVKLLDAEGHEPLWILSLEVLAIEEVPCADPYDLASDDAVTEVAARSISKARSTLQRCERRWHDGPPRIDVLFVREEDGVAEWWSTLFREESEARRWAEYELARRRRRKGTWRAELSAGHWDGEEPRFNDEVSIVRLSTEGRGSA